MKHRQIQDTYVFRLEKGEELVETLRNFCRENKLTSGKISAIGAVNKATIGLFKTGEKQYISKEYQGDFELVSLLGNVSMMDGETYIHLHAVLADEENRCFAGHLNSATVSATLEGEITANNIEIERFFDDNVGLNLYNL